MWRYTLADLRDGDDPEQWAQDLADQGWRTWIETGVSVTINGQLVRRYSLRRWVGPDEKKGPAASGY